MDPVRELSKKDAVPMVDHSCYDRVQSAASLYVGSVSTVCELDGQLTSLKHHLHDRCVIIGSLAILSNCARSLSSEASAHQWHLTKIATHLDAELISKLPTITSPSALTASEGRHLGKMHQRTSKRVSRQPAAPYKDARLLAEKGDLTETCTTLQFSWSKDSTLMGIPRNGSGARGVIQLVACCVPVLRLGVNIFNL